MPGGFVSSPGRCIPIETRREFGATPVACHPGCLSHQASINNVNPVGIREIGRRQTRSAVFRWLHYFWNALAAPVGTLTDQRATEHFIDVIRSESGEQAKEVHFHVS